MIKIFTEEEAVKNKKIRDIFDISDDELKDFEMPDSYWYNPDYIVIKSNNVRFNIPFITYKENNQVYIVLKEEYSTIKNLIKDVLKDYFNDRNFMLLKTSETDKIDNVSNGIFVKYRGGRGSYYIISEYQGDSKKVNNIIKQVYKSLDEI